MTGKQRRDKGLNYERKIRRELINLGFSNCKTSRFESKMVDDQKVDLCGTEPFNFQIKAQVEKPANLTPFRQLNLTPGSRDRLTPSFLTKTVKNFS